MEKCLKHGPIKETLTRYGGVAEHLMYSISLEQIRIKITLKHGPIKDTLTEKFLNT